MARNSPELDFFKTALTQLQPLPDVSPLLVAATVNAISFFVEKKTHAKIFVAQWPRYMSSRPLPDIVFI